MHIPHTVAGIPARISGRIRSTPAAMRTHPIRAALAALLLLALLSGGGAFAHARSAGTYLMTDDQHPQIYINFGKTKLSPGELFTMQVIAASVSRDATLTLRPLSFRGGLQRHLHVVSETAVLQTIPFPNRSFSRPYDGPVLPPQPLDGFRLPPGMTAHLYLDMAADQPGFYFVPTVTVNADAPPVLGLPNAISATYAFDNSMCVEISQQSCDAFTQAAFTTTPHPAQAPVQLWDGSSPDLAGVAALSPDDVWVVGALGIILHLHNGTWTQVANPAGPMQLRGIDMLSPTEGWAVGDQGTILHYHGGAWTQEQVHDQADLFALSMDSPTDGWAVGQGSPDAGTVEDVLFHYSGGVWTPAPTPDGPQFLSSIVMLSPTNGWAAGGGGYILHYDGVSWTRAATPAGYDPAHHFISSLAFPSPRAGWALGSGDALRYDGSSWTDSQPPIGFPLVQGVSMLSPSDGWAVGQENSPGSSGQGVILRCTGGRWQVLDQTFDTDLSAVSMDSPSDGWAVGIGVILHYTHGSWGVIHGPIDVHGA